MVIGVDSVLRQKLMADSLHVVNMKGMIDGGMGRLFE